MKKPIAPQCLNHGDPDIYELKLKFIPQILKYYALQGWTLDHPDRNKNINHLIDFQVAISICRSQDPDLNLTMSYFWEQLVYVWIFNEFYRLDDFIDHLKDNEFSNSLDQYKEFIGQENFDYVYHCLTSFGTRTNQICVLNYGSAPELNFDPNNRESSIDYFTFLSNYFKNLQLVFEDFYEFDNDDSSF